MEPYYHKARPGQEVAEVHAEPMSEAPTSSASAYDSGGARPALLLIHGFCGTWHIWRPVLAALASRHRVIAVTLPGHDGGPVYAGEGDATVAGLADQLIAMMAARGIRQAHVAGNSLGGWLALELARRGFARSVTALSPAGGWRRQEDLLAIAKQFRMAWLAMPAIVVVAALLAWIPAVRRALGRQTMEHAERVPFLEFLVSLLSFRRTTIFHGLLRSFERDGGFVPMKAAVPVRVAWCAADRVIPFEAFGRGMVGDIAGAEATTVPLAGHVPMYDEPAAVAAQILAATGSIDRPEAVPA